jgi:hypothetical protein
MKRVSRVQIKVKSLKECLEKHRTLILRAAYDDLTSVLVDMEGEMMLKHPETGVTSLSIICLDRREVLRWIAEKMADLFDHRIVYAMYS